MKKILCSLLILTGCSTAPVKFISAPDLTRLDYIKAQDNQSVLNQQELITKDFLEAKKQTDQNQRCKDFIELSKIQTFPLKDLALNYAISSCNFSRNQLKKILNSKDINPFLNPFILEELLKVAEVNNYKDLIPTIKIRLTEFINNPNEKIEILNSAISDSRSINDSNLEKEINDKMSSISPRFLDQISKEKYFSAAKDFELVRSFSKARFYYQQIISSDFSLEEKFKAYNGLRTTFKIERDLKTFLEKTHEMETFFKNETEKNLNSKNSITIWIDTQILLAKALWTDHQATKAYDLLKNIIQNNDASKDQKAQAYLVMSGINLEEKNYNNAISNLTLGLEQSPSELSLQENLQWNLIWNNYLLKEYAKVLKLSDLFIKKSTNNNFLTKLQFWRMMTLKRLDKSNEAITEMDRLIADDEFGYYGLISSLIKGQTIKPIVKNELILKNTVDNTLNWLIALDEKKLCQKYLKKSIGLFKTNEDRENSMAIFNYCGWYQGAIRQLTNFPLKKRSQQAIKYINTIYPSPYLDEISRLEQKYKVPRELILAIIRQESVFVENERSWADAFGLMQIIPEKASELSKRHSIEFNQISDLNNPKINIEFGAALLSEAISKYKNKFVQTVASYNASESALESWEKERFNGNYIEFIEMIPYEETRNYVKLVLRNFITYKRILNPNEFKLSDDFFLNSF